MSENNNMYSPHDKGCIIPSEEEDKRLAPLIKKMLEMGIGAVYGVEDEEGEWTEVDCRSRLKRCRSVCCTFQFALTREEVRKGIVRHDRNRPYFIARDPDGYCPHMDRDTFECTVYMDRPLRCRKYDCRDDSQVW
jgi:hypothetical protein